MNEPADRRAEALVRCFEAIARERMAGLPVMHPGLRVEVVGLAPEAGEPAVLSGVLLTPWFMNLVRLPLRRLDGLAGLADGWLPVGQRGSRRLGQWSLDFLGGQEAELGVFESASLFSPMAEFADQAAAQAAAAAALNHLRQVAPEAAAVAAEPAVAEAPPAPVSVPSRRGFLLGRGAAASPR